jgi:hypothetical protein
VAKKENIIELNGKRYDAYSGVMLSDIRVTPRHTQAAGVHTPAAPKPQAPKILDITRPTPHHVKHHAPKKSATLMRHTVTKPSGSLKRNLKTHSHTHALVAQPSVKIVPKLSHPNVDVRRVKRAHHVPRSEMVRRYAETAAIVPRPAHAAAIKPVHASSPAIHTVAAPRASSMDVFERALQQANSHLQPHHAATKQHKERKWGKRALNVAAASLTLLAIAGFVAFQNQANLTIKYAAHKAGISAMLPSSSPAGYSAGKISYSPGTVAINYKNADGNQSFALTQTASNWDSLALRDNFVASADTNYHAMQAAGRTVYTYGNGDATWVNGGIWYKVVSNGSLTTNELIDLASSM